MPTLNEIRAQIDRLGDVDKFGTKKEIRYLPEIMEPGEEVKGLAPGLMDSNTWLVVCTDRRIIFLDKGLVYGLQQIEIPLEQVSSVSHNTGMMFGTVEILGAGLSGMKVKQIEKKTV